MIWMLRKSEVAYLVNKEKRKEIISKPVMTYLVKKLLMQHLFDNTHWLKNTKNYRQYQNKIFKYKIYDLLMLKKC